MEASEYPGREPQSDVRRYFLTDDDFLIGVAVTIDAEGNPGFLQFTAKTDGAEYPEYSIEPLSRFQRSGEVTPFTYSETQRDDYAIEWADKYNGDTYVSGTRSVSEDGQTLTIVAVLPERNDQARTYTIVYDRVDGGSARE